MVVPFHHCELAYIRWGRVNCHGQVCWLGQLTLPQSINCLGFWYWLVTSFPSSPTILSSHEFHYHTSFNCFRSKNKGFVIQSQILKRKWRRGDSLQLFAVKFCIPAQRRNDRHLLSLGFLWWELMWTTRLPSLSLLPFLCHRVVGLQTNKQEVHSGSLVRAYGYSPISVLSILHAVQSCVNLLFVC